MSQMAQRIAAAVLCTLGAASCKCTPVATVPRPSVIEATNCKWETDPTDPTKKLWTCTAQDGTKIVIPDTTGVGGGGPQ